MTTAECQQEIAELKKLLEQQKLATATAVAGAAAQPAATDPNSFMLFSFSEIKQYLLREGYVERWINNDDEKLRKGQVCSTHIVRPLTPTLVQSGPASPRLALMYTRRCVDRPLIYSGVVVSTG